MNGDGKRLRQGDGPSLPADYVQAVDGCFVGPSAGSCGGRGIAARKGFHVRHRHQSPLGRWRGGCTREAPADVSPGVQKFIAAPLNPTVAESTLLGFVRENRNAVDLDQNLD